MYPVLVYFGNSGSDWNTIIITHVDYLDHEVKVTSCLWEIQSVTWSDISSVLFPKLNTGSVLLEPFIVVYVAINTEIHRTENQDQYKGTNK